MRSHINLGITIEHEANIPDAERIAQIVADELAKLTRAEGGSYTWGRRTVRGREDGPNVTVFLQSAAITRQEETR